MWLTTYPPAAGGIVIRLKTAAGTVYADIFLTDDERSVGVVLYRNDRPVAAESFTNQTLRGMIVAVLDWLGSRRLDELSVLRLCEELNDAFEMLDTIRRNGPDIAHDWPGSRHSRRLPDLAELRLQ